MDTMEEKREFQRFDMDLPVTVRHNGILLAAKSLNISLGGLCIEATFSRIKDKGVVEVCIDLDRNSKDISIMGEILRIEKNDESFDSCKLGIKFNNQSSAGHAQLKKFLKNCMH